jgi:hypothetical protein
MKINLPYSLLAATAVSCLPPVASSIVGTSGNTGRNLFSPITGDAAFDSSALNDTELIAKSEACLPTLDGRKSQFLEPFLTPEFLNSTTCLDPDGTLGARGTDPTATWLLTFGFNGKLFFDNNLADEYIGDDPANTKLTESVRKVHDDIQWFWGLSAEMRQVDPLIGQMPLKGLHNSFYTNDDASFEATARTNPVLANLPPEKNAKFPSFEHVQSCVIDFLDNPGLTFNAKYVAPISVLPGLYPGSQIMWGDGIVKFMQSISIDEDDALLRIAAFHGHEYGHHVGILIGDVPIQSPIPEETRFSELLTDSLSAYWNAHTCGNALGADEMEVVADTLFAVGDCNFDNPTHHGTPDQRACAVRWGAYLAHESPDIIEPSNIIARFKEDLNDILAVDMEAACPRFNSTQAAESFSNKMQCPWIRQPSAVRREDNSADGGRTEDMDVDDNSEEMPQALDESEGDTTSSGFASILSSLTIASCVFFSSLAFW